MRPSATPTGLTAAEVVASRAAHGANVLTPPPRESPLRQLAAKFADPLIVILLAAGALSLGVAAYEFAALGEGAAAFFEPVGIFVAVLLATGLSFLFERRAGRAFDLLNQVNDDEPVLAVRDGETVRIPKRDVVVGDIVSLATGDEIPADGELLDAVSLGVDESTLTGEPLCRKTTDPRAFDRDATFPSNHVLRGTKVMEGHGTMRVQDVRLFGPAAETEALVREGIAANSTATLNLANPSAPGLSAYELCLFFTAFVVGQVAIVSFGGRMFGVVPLALSDWVLVFLLTAAVPLVARALTACGAVFLPRGASHNFPAKK